MGLPRDEETVARMGWQIYRDVIRGQLTEADHGKWVVIYVYSSDYQIGTNSIGAGAVLQRRRPAAVTWTYQIIVGGLD